MQLQGKGSQRISLRADAEAKAVRIIINGEELVPAPWHLREFWMREFINMGSVWGRLKWWVTRRTPDSGCFKLQTAGVEVEATYRASSSGKNLEWAELDLNWTGELEPAEPESDSSLAGLPQEPLKEFDMSEYDDF